MTTTSNVLRLTDEQERIVNSSARRLAVEAGAGAAKTTTLVAYAEARPAESILYIAFNRSIAEEARSRMPAHVKCQTMHSMAWRKACELFGDRARDRVGKTYPSTVARTLGCAPLVAMGALAAVQAWCGSDDDELGDEHLPLEIVQRTQDPEGLLGAARALWARMLDPHEQTIRMIHDAYLKLLQLDGPQLRRYETILCDEAQDLSKSTFVLLQQQRARLVLVGDSAQAIYGFRGTTDALRQLRADERLPLTRSFRFGQGVATMANALLFAYKPGHRHALVGVGEPRQTALRFDTEEPHAIIARTNAALFDAAVQALHTKRPYHFVGGLEGYAFEKVRDCYHLWVGDTSLIRDPYLRSFGSFQELEELAEASDDKELKRLAKVVLEYQRRIPELVDRISTSHVELEGAALRTFRGLVFCTAHKSKGLEFDRVWLVDDFQRLMEGGVELDAEEVDQQEVNVQYVALTRARAAVRLNEGFEEWLRYRQVVR